MIGLFDRDVFLKLCCCNLWNEANEALDVTSPYRLASTSSERSNRKALSRMLAPESVDGAIQRTLDVAARVPVLSEELIQGIVASERYSALGHIEDIDTGEQVLVAVLMEQPEGRILITGDKRFVTAFRNGLPDQWASHRSAIISFERCLTEIERRHGFDHLLARAFGASSCDQSLRLALGQNPNRESFLAAMQSFDPCR